MAKQKPEQNKNELFRALKLPTFIGANPASYTIYMLCT